MDLTTMLASMPFGVAVGVELDAASADEVRGHLDWSEARCTTGGAMHGAAIMALHDSLAASAPSSPFPRAATSTIETKTNFMGAVRSGSVNAVARPVHVGRTTIVVQTEGRTSEGRLVALTTQTQAVVPARSGG